MIKRLIALFSTILIIGVLAACGSSANNATDNGATTNDQQQQPNKTQTEVTPTGKTVEVTVNAKNFDFDVKEIKAHLGDKVKITLKNDDGAHGFAIDDFGVDIKGGETAEFLVDKKGTFDYYCSLMCGVGHDQMKGKLVVE
jgi:cytochrome c oxidase subunit 2